MAWLERGDDASIQDALDRAAYLAKEYTKVNGINERFDLFVIFTGAPVIANCNAGDNTSVN
ncbi:hypothetical protein [Escherichia coli]|uniref:hypothetical protein n=1 Tax=Escherichia coli TaxID=562 RepID=UPI00092D895A|nr:hypothetical protein [Escherichia coli]APJ91934.1 hypothetical protein RG32_13865 [Escherichia coli]APJ94137.1 hypothetical protein RG33_00280 [Escherichia coli]EFB1497916.1 hypothetical protein [Escherichia coli]EFH7398725.1 hypothetical protein [Escherichia coli]EFO0548219.1 hypothetical protein [Escherichia coli]